MYRTSSRGMHNWRHSWIGCDMEGSFEGADPFKSVRVSHAQVILADYRIILGGSGVYPTVHDEQVHSSARRQADDRCAWRVGDITFDVASVLSVRTRSLQLSVLAGGLAVTRCQNCCAFPQTLRRWEAVGI